MIEEGLKLEPLAMALSTNFDEEFRSQVVPSIQTALLESSELEVTDEASWMEIYVCLQQIMIIGMTLEREMLMIAGPCDCVPDREGA